MAHPNEELVRRGYEAFNNADVETLRELFADTTIFHEPGHNPSPATSCATNCGPFLQSERGD